MKYAYKAQQNCGIFLMCMGTYPTKALARKRCDDLYNTTGRVGHFVSKERMADNIFEAWKADGFPTILKDYSKAA